jgi:hypothetical protein
MNGLIGLLVGQIADPLRAARPVGACIVKPAITALVGGDPETGGAAVGRGTGVVRHHFDIGAVTVSVIFVI